MILKAIISHSRTFILRLTAQRLIAFTPDALGQASFQYDLIDARGAASVIDVTLTVLPLRDPILPVDDSLSTLQGQVLLINPSILLANDVDPFGDVLIIASVDRFAKNGKVSLGSDGTITFTPRTDYNGLAGFHYQVSDGHGGTAEAFVSVNVVPSNQGATLQGDVLQAVEDVAITVLPAEVFGNDRDPDGDVLFFQSVSVLGVLDTKYLSAGVQFSAQNSRGKALPSWLSFDPLTLTFQGLMPAGQTGTVTAGVKVFDPANGSSFVTYFEFDANSAAALAIGISEKGAVLKDYAIRANLNTDFEFGGRNLGPDTSVTATLTDGSPLPSWLHFNPSQLSFTRTAPTNATAPVEIVLTFTHLSAATPTNPAVTTALSKTLTLDPAALIAGQLFDSGTAILSCGAGSFTARLASGHPLPEWLDFDPATMTLSRTDYAPVVSGPLARVQIIFTPQSIALLPDVHFATERGFTLEFVIDPSLPLNPAINALLGNNAFFASQGWFAVDLNGATSVSAHDENGNSLPTWLHFDPARLSFTGAPPPQYVGAVPVRLDVSGNGASLPDFSIITDVVVDQSYHLVGDNKVTASAAPELLSVATPTDFNGSLALAYTTVDDKGGVSTRPGIIVVDVAPLAEKPRAVADRFETLQGQSVTFSLDVLLANDRDDDGDRFRAVRINQPLHGIITTNLVSLEFAPPSALVRVSGGLYSATLVGGAALPGWMVIDAVTGQVNVTPPLGISQNYALVYALTSGATSLSAQATYAIDGNEGVTFTYTPEASYYGTDTLSYVITDDHQGETTGQISVAVSPPLTASADLIDAFEDVVLILDPSRLLANDIGRIGQPLTVTSAMNALHGSVTFDGSQILFTPDHNFDGAAQFEYGVTDGTGHTAVALVTVSVQSTNLAPIAVADHSEGTEDVPLTILIADLLANDSDPDVEPFHFVSISDAGTQGRALLLPGARIQFVPSENLNGTLTFNYVISDGRRSTTGSVDVNFMAINDAPIANPNGGFTGLENTPVRISLATLLANDRDVEGDSFTIVSVIDGDNGTAVIDGTETVFTPRRGYFGNAAFQYVVQDARGAQSTGVVSLTISPQYHLPIAVSDSGYEILQDTSIDVDPAALMANDIDPDGNILSFVGFVDGSAVKLASGLYRITPSANFSGPLVMTYAITNGSGVAVPTTLTINVLHVEHAPVAVDDALNMVEDTARVITTASLLTNDYDLDAQALAFTRILAMNGVTVTADGHGHLTITPDVNLNGAAWFDYEIADSTDRTSSTRVNLAIAAVNDAPVIGTVPILAGTEDQLFSATLPASLFSDVENDALFIDAQGAGGTALPVWLTFDRRTLTFTGTPPANFNGLVILELIADDGQLITTKPVVVSVRAVNDAPVVGSAVTLASLLEDTSRTVTVAQLLAQASDVDGDTLSIVNLTSSSGTLVATGAGVWTFTPALNDDSAVTFSFGVSDGVLTTAATAILDLLPVNDAPTIAALLVDVHAPEDRAVSVTVPAQSFADVDDSLLTLSAARADGSALPNWLSFDGARFTGMPPANFNGTLALQVRASDGVASVVTPFNLIIDPVNDAPIAAILLDDVSVAEDTPVNILIPISAFTDVDADTLTLTAALTGGGALPSWLSFDGSRIVGTPPANFNGTVALTVSASDGTLSASQSFTLLIAPVNDGPSIAASTAAIGNLTERPLLTASAFNDVATGALTFVDPDVGDIHAASITGVTVSGATAGLPAPATLLGWFATGALVEPIVATAGTVGWTFTAPDAAFDYLAAGQTATFTYTVALADNHGASVTQNIIVTITGTNDAPLMSVPGAQTTAATVAIPISGIVVSDADPSATETVTLTTTLGTLAATATSGAMISGAASQTLSISGSLAAVNATLATLNYTSLVAGADSIALSASDGTALSSKTIAVTNMAAPNQAPLIAAGTIATGAVSELTGVSGATTLDTASGAIRFTDANPADLHNTSVTGVTVSGVTSGLPASTTLLALISTNAATEQVGATAGTIGWSFAAADKMFDYLAAGESATLTYAVLLSDNHGGSVSQNVTLTVSGSNDGPVIALGTSAVAAITELTSVTGSLANDSATGVIRFSDLDTSDLHSASITGVVASGTVTGLPASATLLGWLAKGSLTEQAGPAAGSLPWTFTAPDSAFDYLAAGQATTLTYTLVLADNNGGTVNQTVSVTITGTNDAPLIAVPTAQIARTATATRLSGIIVTDADPSAVETITLTTTLGTVAATATSGATLTGSASKSLKITGTLAQVNATLGTLTYTAATAGSDTINLLASDGAASSTKTIGVTSSATANHGPVINANTTASGAITERAATTASALADTATGIIRFNDADVPDTHTVTISSVSATGVVAGLPANAALLAFLTKGAVTEPVGTTPGAVTWTFSAADKTFDYLGAGQSATLTYVVTVTDSKAAVTTQNVTINVTGTNDAAVIATGSTTTAALTERAGLTASVLTDTATGAIKFNDEVGDIHSAVITGVAASGVVTGLPASAAMLAWLAKGTLTEQVGATAGSLPWTFTAPDSAFDYLAAGQVATLTYTLQISDTLGAVLSQNVVVSVTGTNDTPTATAKTGFTTDNWTALTVTGATLLAGSTDPDKADTLTLATVQGAVGGTVALTAGNAVFTPTATALGAASFTYTISDGHGGTATATASLTTTLHQINGTAGIDTLTGGAKSAQIDGLGGNDIIKAGTAGDKLIGGAGSDTLTGGAGIDTFIYHTGFGLDTINSFTATGSLHDILQVDKTIFADWAHLLGATAQVGTDLIITLDPTDKITLKNVALASFTSADAAFI
jgi:VCBS repeat-containing protein